MNPYESFVRARLARPLLIAALMVAGLALAEGGRAPAIGGRGVLPFTLGIIGLVAAGHVAGLVFDALGEDG